MTAAALKAAATGQVSHAPLPGAASVFQELLKKSFDPDAWHVMQERDNALIRDEVMHGQASKAFVYSFDMQGKTVTGVSVVGARELAAQYKGIKSRIVATVEKRGALFIFRTFTPLGIETRHLTELEADDDFYECVVEISDIKTGNSIEVRKKETKFERRRDGSAYARPHYDVIAESKAYRNGVLSVLPQSVIQDFKTRCLSAGNVSKEQTIDQRRAAASTFAAKHGIALNRQALGDMSYAELDGLGAAAAQDVESFLRSASALGLVVEATGEVKPPAPAAAAPKPAATARKGAKEAPPAQSAPPATRTYAQFADELQKAKNADAAALILDEARGSLDEQLQGELGQLFTKKWGG